MGWLDKDVVRAAGVDLGCSDAVDRLLATGPLDIAECPSWTIRTRGDLESLR